MRRRSPLGCDSIYPCGSDPVLTHTACGAAQGTPAEDTNQTRTLNEKLEIKSENITNKVTSEYSNSGAISAQIARVWNIHVTLELIILS